MPPVLTYSSSKAALHSLTQSTRAMLRGQGTFVVGVYPGPVDTDMSSDFLLDKVSPASVAHAILDGLERGQEEIYPDPFAVEYGEAYAVNPKGLEARIATLAPSSTRAGYRGSSASCSWAAPTSPTPSPATGP